MSVTLNTRQVGDITVVDVEGRITMNFLPKTNPWDPDIKDPECGSVKFREALRGLVAQGKRRILFNLGEVTYIDSSGIGELVSGFTVVTNAGGQLKLLNLTKRVKDLLQITKLYTVFDVHEDEAAAIRSFANSSPTGTTSVRRGGFSTARVDE